MKTKNEKRQYNENSPYVWLHSCKGMEICSGCRKQAKLNETRIWVSDMDFDNLFCLECAELTPKHPDEYETEINADIKRHEKGEKNEQNSNIL